MKIVYIIPGTGVSGGIAVICQHANRLINRGHDVFLLSDSGDRKIDWFPNLKASVIIENDLPYDVDILVATGWSTSFNAINFPAKKKFYFVQSNETRFHPQGSDYQYFAALSYNLYLNYFTEAVWIKKWLSDNFNHEAELIPNGLDSEIFFPDIPIETKTKKPRILLEGAIDLPYKGMKEAFSVVSEIDAEIWCVSSFGIPDPSWHCDRFFSQVSIETMRKIYSSCDILLKMSRVEGFFGPPMEMMACGGAVVVGKVTGYDEYIVDEYNALVVEEGDIHSAKKAIMRILDNPDLKNQLIKNGKSTAQSWQWDPSIDKLEKYFVEVLSGEKGIVNLDVKDMSNKSIALSYKLFNTKPKAITDIDLGHLDPVDRVFLKIKKISIIRKIAFFTFIIFRKTRLYIKKIINLLFLNSTSK